MESGEFLVRALDHYLNPTPERKDFVCSQCNAVFQSTKKRNFCSYKCYDAHRNESREYPKEWTTALKDRIRERDAWGCAVCGAIGMTVHHIDENKQNSKPSNLITLCASCHAHYHTTGQMKSLIPYFKTIIGDTKRNAIQE